jgi:VCBS repeat-containing protein
MLTNWLNSMLGRSSRNGCQRRQIQMARGLFAVEALESRLVLSVDIFSVTDSDVAFSTSGQNMWATGPEATISAGFEHTLLDVNFPNFNFGGFASIFGAGETGLRASFSGGFDLGFSGFFDVTGGAVDVDYQTDITVSALTTSGEALTGLVAGEHFIVTATESPDVDQIRMQTEFANLAAGLNVDFGLRAHGGILGKILGKTVVNAPLNVNFSRSQELIGAELNPGEGIAELRVLGGTLPGTTFDLVGSFSDPTGIVNGEGFVPSLNTGVPNDGFDDSQYFPLSGHIVNQHLPVNRSQGQTRIDFFRLGLGLDNLVTAATGVPLAFDIGNDHIKVDVTLIDANLDAYLGIAQQMTFEPIVMVDLNFATPTPVETSPGSGLFQTVTTKRIGLNENIEIIHLGGGLEIGTEYVLTGQFRNKTDIYLSPGFSVEVGKLELGGSLVNKAQSLGLLDGVDLSFSLLPERHFPLGPPIPIIGLFDETFDLQGFMPVDRGNDLLVTASDPTEFTVIATAEVPQISEGQDLVVTGTIFDPVPDPENIGTETYTLTIDWKDGPPQTVNLDSSNPAENVTFDAESRVFTASHRYIDQVGTQTLTVTAARTDASESDEMLITVQVSNAAPTVQLDPLFLDNNGNATLTGTFIDPGVKDSHTLEVEWGDDPATDHLRQPVVFSLPQIDMLNVGFEQIGFHGIEPIFQFLEVTSVNKETGEVGFRITGKRYGNIDLFGKTFERAVERPLLVKVDDEEGGVGEDSVRVPWGFTLSVPNITSTVSENGVASLDIRFTDVNRLTVEQTGTNEFEFHGIQSYTVVVNWGDENDPRSSTFHVVADLEFQLTFSLVSFELRKTVNVTGTESTTDDAVLSLTSFDFELLDSNDGQYLFTPTFQLERRYLDDGDAASGNGTPFDTSHVVVNMFDGDSFRGGTVIRPITVHNVAPTLTLDETEEVNAGGLAILNGKISDPGRLDAFTLEVDWGDGSPIATYFFDPSPTGSQEFAVSHIYAEDLDGGSYQVTATVFDDDGGSDTATAAFVVDFDKPPAAFDDFVTAMANEILLIDVLADNDDDPDTFGDIDPEGHLDPARTILIAGSGSHAFVEDLLTNNGDGTFTFNPGNAFDFLAEGQTATVTFDYQIEDSTEGQTDTATVTITVVGVNDPPVIDLNGDAAGVDFAATFTEDGGPVAIGGSDLALVDPDVATGDIFVINRDGRIVRIDPETGDQTVLEESGPVIAIAGHIAIDPETGALFALDQSRIVKVDPVTGEETILAEQFHDPWDLEIDGNGDLIVTRPEIGAISRINPETGVVTFIRSGGGFWAGLAIEANGRLLVSDLGLNRIVRVHPTTGSLQTVSSGRLLSQPNDIAVDALGNILVADGSGKVIRIDPVSGAQTLLASGGNLNNTFSVIVDGEGDIFATNLNSNRVIRIDPASGAQSVVSEGDSLTSTAGAVSASAFRTMVSATVTITNLKDGADESLSADVTGTQITAEYESATGVLTLTGEATQAIYQKVLRTVTYNNTSQDPHPANRLIEWTAIDGANQGPVSTTTLTVIPVNDPPVVNAGADATIDEGSLFAGSGSFSDPDSADSWTATVDYGDGSGPKPLALNLNKTFNLSHVYADNGVFEVIVTVTDAEGEVATDQLVVTVNNVAPELRIDADISPIDENGVATVSGEIIDPGTQDAITVQIDWGDGSPPEVFQYAPGVRSFSETHRYLDDDKYVIRISASDNDGAQAPEPLHLLGSEFRVQANIMHESFQFFGTSVASDGAGNFVVVWNSFGQDGDQYGISAQRYDAGGAPVGGEFQVNTFTESFQIWPGVAMDDAGNFVVAWSSLDQDGSGFGVFAQRYDPSGDPVGGEFQVNTSTENSQLLPTVAMDGSGGFIVAWQSDGQGVYAQRYDSNGDPVGDEFRVNTFTAGSPRNVSVVSDGAGNFVIAWDSDGQDGSGRGVYGQRYDSDGMPVGSEFQVNTFTSGSQSSPSVAMDGAGNFVVAWQGEGEGGFGVYGQSYSADGTPVGGEFQIDTITSGSGGSPSVAMDGAGNFVVTWHINDPVGGEGGVYGQRYDADGISVGSEFQINTETINQQQFSQVTLDGAGNFVVVWLRPVALSSQWDVVARRYAGGLEVVVNNVAPQFEAGLDETLHPPVAGVFNRTIDFTDPGTLDTHTVTVNFGDGTGDHTFAVGPAGTRVFDLDHTFTADGTYLVRVTVEDDDLGAHTDTFEVTVFLNTPPEADAGGPYTITVGESLMLDASGSSDPDNDPLTFAWDLTGNGVFDDATGESPTLTWTALVDLGISGPNTFVIDVMADDGTATDIAETTVTVLHATPTVTVEWAGGTYNGSAFEADGSVTGFDGVVIGVPTFTYFVGTGIEGVPLSAAPRDAGTYTVLAEFAGDILHTAASATATITIEKATANIMVNGTTVTYDGNAHGATGTATGVNNESLSGLDLGASFTNVPGGTANWTFTDETGNYNDASGTVAIVINKATANIVVNGTTVTYDGQAHGATGMATGAAGENLTALLDLGNSFIDHPGGTAEWSFVGDNNHHAANGSVEIVINKATANIMVNGTTVPYDGNAHGATGTATGVNNESLSGLDLGASFTNVPGGTANWTFTDETGNYNDAGGSVEIVIQKAELAVEVDDATWEIGTEFPVFTGTISGAVAGESFIAVYSSDGNETSQVGEYDITAEVFGETLSNYSVIVNEGTLTVTPKQVEIDIHQSTLNIDSNGTISLVILGSSSFDVSQATLLAGFMFAGVEMSAFNQTFVDANGDGNLDLMLHFQITDELRDALKTIYADLLSEDYADDGDFSHKQLATLSLEGSFGEHDQEFEGSDAMDLLFSGKALRELLESLDL